MLCVIWVILQIIISLGVLSLAVIPHSMIITTCHWNYSQIIQRLKLFFLEITTDLIKKTRETARSYLKHSFLLLAKRYSSSSFLLNQGKYSSPVKTQSYTRNNHRKMQFVAEYNPLSNLLDPVSKRNIRLQLTI